MSAPVDEAQLEAALCELESLDRAALAARWAKAFGRPAPFKARADLLRGGLAWCLQMRASGRAPTVASLIRLLRSALTASTALTEGATLMREWAGRMHYVHVLAKGFEYEGKTYSSLSALARKITGTSYSGPRFFGLRRK